MQSGLVSSTQITIGIFASDLCLIMTEIRFLSRHKFYEDFKIYVNEDLPYKLRKDHAVLRRKKKRPCCLRFPVSCRLEFWKFGNQASILSHPKDGSNNGGSFPQPQSSQHPT